MRMDVVCMILYLWCAIAIESFICSMRCAGYQSVSTSSSLHKLRSYSTTHGFTENAESCKITSLKSECINKQEREIMEYGSGCSLVLGVIEETEDVDDWTMTVSKAIEDKIAAGTHRD
jgi:hypothetical protein